MMFVPSVPESLYFLGRLSIPQMFTWYAAIMKLQTSMLFLASALSALSEWWVFLHVIEILQEATSYNTFDYFVKLPPC